MGIVFFFLANSIQKDLFSHESIVFAKKFRKEGLYIF